MRKRLTLWKCLLLVALSLAAVAPGANAEDVASFPSRKIRIVVPYAAGGAADIISRVTARYAAEVTHWQFYVENITGGAGLVGAQAAAHSIADGYTLLLCNISCATNQFLHRDAGWNPNAAIAPVVVLGYLPNILVVGANSKAATLKDFIKRAKANPGQITIATSGHGSSSSMSADLLMEKAGIRMTEIPYRGSSAATPDLISGRVDAMIMGLPELLPLVRGGKLKALGVTSAERAASLPDVPTIAEAGVAGYQYLGWLSLFAPKGTPDAIVAKLNGALNKALASPALRKRFSDLSIQPGGGPPALAGRLLDDDSKLWKPILHGGAGAK